MICRCGQNSHVTHCWEDDLCTENQSRHPRSRRVIDHLRGQSEGKAAGETFRAAGDKRSLPADVGEIQPSVTYLVHLSIYSHERRGTRGQSQHHL